MRTSDERNRTDICVSDMPSWKAKKRSCPSIPVCPPLWKIPVQQAYFFLEGALNLVAGAAHVPAPLCDHGSEGLCPWVIGRTGDGCGVNAGPQEDDSCCDAELITFRFPWWG